MKILLPLCFCLLGIAAKGAVITTDTSKIEAAEKALRLAIIQYSSCVIDGVLHDCVQSLVAQANDPFRQYVAGGMLYAVDANQSFTLHKQAFTADSTQRAFILEYALEQHRRGNYAAAIPLYIRCLDSAGEDPALHAWLADCYINTDRPDEAVRQWQLAGHAAHHTEIDFALHTVYGHADLFAKRDALRDKIRHAQADAAYALVYLDMNWTFDWWNVGIQQYFLDADRTLIHQYIPAEQQRLLDLYIRVKDLSNGENKRDSIRLVLDQGNVLLGDKPMFPNSIMCADLLRICFANGVLKEHGFYAQRGAELLKKAKTEKDGEWLNSYAWLQSAVNGKVDASVDLDGWKQFKEERFAVSYFIGRKATLHYGDASLNQALKDFPHSAMLYWIQANLAHEANKPVKPLLITLIRNEFKTLSSDENHYSDRLNMYFDLLGHN